MHSTRDTEYSSAVHRIICCKLAIYIPKCDISKLDIISTSA